MRDAARRIAVQTKARKAPQPAYDPYASYGAYDDSGGWIGSLPVKVVSVLDLTEDAHRSGIQRGMRVLDLGCGLGDVSLWIAELVGPTGLVVGVDDSPEAVNVAEKRATVTGQCYWTRFVTADINTFNPLERFDVVVLRHVPPPQRASLVRLSNLVHPDGVIIITGNPAGRTDIRSVKWLGRSSQDGQSLKPHQESASRALQATQPPIASWKASCAR